MTRALSRDASWYAKPELYLPKSFHVEVESRRGFSRCNRFLPLVEASAIPLGEVPLNLRCRRRGCREAWPAAPDAPRTTTKPAPLADILARVEATLRAAR